jgi:hypothetical protein
MGLACGVWGWSADDFWRATPFDLGFAFRGYQKLHGQAGLSAEDLQELKNLLETNS